jgi:hypothetical protein
MYNIEIYLCCRYRHVDKMIALRTLKYLSTQRVKDAEALMVGHRYNGAVYMIGYALEFSLKRKLSNTLGFNSGFPETNGEMRHYYNTQLAAFNAIGTGITLNQINQIRNHKLIELLKFSGAEARIVASYFNEWSVVCNWDPEKRYVRQNWTVGKAADFMNSARIILKQIG